MSKIITAFNGRILNKIGAYLRAREGCIVNGQAYTEEGARMTIQDSMGFIYEITIRTTGRTQVARNETLHAEKR